MTSGESGDDLSRLRRSIVLTVNKIKQAKAGTRVQCEPITWQYRNHCENPTQQPLLLAVPQTLVVRGWIAITPLR